MAPQTGLENRRSGNVTVGSNPTLSAVFRGYSPQHRAAPSTPFTPRSAYGDGAKSGTLVTVYVCGEPVLMEQRDIAAIERAMHESADRSDCGKLCYFAADPCGLIKIGYTEDMASRLRKLRAAHSPELSIVATATGGIEREAAYHFQFAAHRLHGEWFAPHPDILAEIDRLNDRAATGVQSRAALTNAKGSSHGCQ